MSYALSEMRVVVARSSETILCSNNIPSTSSMFPHDVLGSMEHDMMILVIMEPQVEKMYLDQQEVIHMVATTTTTPTSYERYSKGKMGVDDSMIPLVDMVSYVDDDIDLLHAMDDFGAITYDSFIFLCDDLPLHIVDHVELFDCDDLAIHIPCYESFIYPTIALDMPFHECFQLRSLLIAIC